MRCCRDYSRLRLPAELIRDAALYAGGLLTLEVGGRSVKPPQPAGVASLAYGAKGDDSWRKAKATTVIAADFISTSSVRRRTRC